MMVEFKTQEEQNKYVDALKKLVAKQNNKPCMEWQCKEALKGECYKAPCKFCCYYGCWCCLYRDKCVLKEYE